MLPTYSLPYPHHPPPTPPPPPTLLQFWGALGFLFLQL